MLNNTQIKNAKAKEKQYRLSDGNGLYLEITPKGSKRWRWRYRYARKEKMLSLGLYPAVSLKQARERAEDMRRQLGEGLDPSQIRKEKKFAEGFTFEVVALEWLEKFSGQWTEGHARNLRVRLEQGMLPFIGGLPVNEISAPMILAPLRQIEARGALELAKRTLQITSQVFRYAIATGYAERDPAADLRGAIAPAQVQHRAAITDPRELAGLLRAIDTYTGHIVTHCALRLLPLVFVRPGELRHAVWPEFDLDGAEWRIPAERMKMKEAHVVPLSRQALAILEELRPLTGSGSYVFPSLRSPQRCMSENTINAALRRLGYSKDEMTGHGFRAVASTLLNEQGKWSRDAIERQLAHGERNKVRAAYNHAQHLPERRKMMQSWSDYLDGLKAGAKIIPLKIQA